MGHAWSGRFRRRALAMTAKQVEVVMKRINFPWPTLLLLAGAHWTGLAAVRPTTLPAAHFDGKKGSLRATASAPLRAGAFPKIQSPPSQESKDAEGYHKLGLAYADAGRYAEAVDALKEAVRLKADFIIAHNDLGYVFSYLGRHEDAVESYQRAIQHKPDYVKAHNNLGMAYGQLGRYDEAIASFKRAITLQPAYAAAHYNLGAAYYKSGRDGEAVESLKEAIRLKHD
jgi:tetratricopeptide (TPR) repeat protein